MDKKKKSDTQKSVKSKSKDAKSKDGKSKDAKSKDGKEPKSKGKDKDATSVKKGKEVKQKSKKSASKADLDKSEVSSIPPSPSINLTCIHHKFPFIYFCQTCEQLVCNQCIVFGPHNNHLHRILKITDAYRSRVFHLSEAIRTNLVDKRDKIIAQLHRIEYRVEEIRFVKNIIERDIRSEYGGSLERLKSSEGTKMALLSHEMSVIQKDIDSINDLGNKFFELTNLQTDADKQICKFLTKSKHMYEAIEYHLNKPEKQPLHIDTNDLPQEIQKNRGEIKKAISSKEISDFKNQLIWQLINETRSEADKIKKELELKADSMIRNLSEQAESYNQHLSQFQMICSFCLIALSPETVNEKCIRNATVSQAVADTRMVVALPPEKFLGSGRHFFSKPSREYYDMQKQTQK